MQLDPGAVDEIIKAALEEDLGNEGDITTKYTISDPRKTARARIIARSSGVIAGIFIGFRVFELIESSVDCMAKISEGGKVKEGETVALVQGAIQTILAGERTALNFLQHLSGIATLTSKFVQKVSSSNVQILDTRKTIPGLRVLEKYAVKAGGGENHRFGLYDGVLIKDNHIKAAGGIKKAVESVRRNAPSGTRIEVEAESLSQAREALEARADIVMLDNMGCGEMKKAVDLAKGRVIFEASGNITLDNVRDVAETGVDWISAGSLTRAASSLDMSLEIIESNQNSHQS